MQRRRFIAGLSATLVLPAVRAAAATRIARLGFLGFAPPAAWTSELDALRAGLRDLGYRENEQYVFEFKWAESVDQMPKLAAELVRSNVDIIIAPASTQVEPARRATSTVPIVFAQHADPVGSGHVASLAHPGGNITGVSMLLRELAAKSLEILSQAVPNGGKFAVLWNPTTPSHAAVNQELERAAKSLGVELISTPVSAVADFDGAFAIMTDRKATGFLVPSSPLTNSQPAALAELALRHRIPGMFGNKENVKAGGLMSYGADFDQMYRRAAAYVDKILKGEKPADIPVEQASKFYLVINMKTAREIGFEMPATLLARADEVIE
jgi:putative tryptophan/tyrosine transport system substrate-binding protein